MCLTSLLEYVSSITDFCPHNSLKLPHQLTVSGAEEWHEATSASVSSGASPSHTYSSSGHSGRDTWRSHIAHPCCSVLHGGRRQIDVLFAFYFTYHLISLSSSLVPETHAWDFSCTVFHHYIQNQLFSLRILIASVQKFPCILFSHLTIFLRDFASWLLSFDLIFCCFSIKLFFF